MIIECPLNGQYHDHRDVILTSRMAVSNNFITVTIIQNIDSTTQSFGISQNYVFFSLIFLHFGHQNLAKSWKKEIVTSIWNSQHPNTDQNIQELKFPIE